MSLDNCLFDKAFKLLLRKHRYGVRSIISKFGRRNEPPVGMLPDRSKYTTVADVIKVDNDQAWNALLDHCSIERIVLFDDPAKAERVMKTGRKNVMRAVMEDGMIVEIKNGVTSNFANRQASQPLQYINANVKQLNEDLKGRIVSKKRELDRFKIDFKNAEKKKKDLQNEVRGLKNEIRTLERKEKACDKSIASVEREIENMQAAEDDREDPSQVKDEIRETEVELKVHVKELEKLNLEGNEMKKKRDEVVEAMKKCSVKIDEIEKSVKTNVDEVARLEDDLDNLKTGHERVKEAITKYVALSLSIYLSSVVPLFRRLHTHTHTHTHTHKGFRERSEILNWRKDPRRERSQKR